MQATDYDPAPASFGNALHALIVFERANAKLGLWVDDVGLCGGQIGESLISLRHPLAGASSGTCLLGISAGFEKFLLRLPVQPAALKHFNGVIDFSERQIRQFKRLGPTGRDLDTID